MSKPANSDIHQLELLISRLLSSGVLISTVLVALGGFAYLSAHGSEPAQYHVFVGEPEFLRSVKDVWSAFLSFRPRAVIQVGLLVLVLTPLMRVFLTFLLFSWRKDLKLASLSLIVLIVLSCALLLED